MQYIFIHGIGHDPSSWDKTISFFTKPIHAMCPDLVMLINHNDSTYSNLYRAFSDYCKNIPEPLNLCGLSLGATLYKGTNRVTYLTEIAPLDFPFNLYFLIGCPNNGNHQIQYMPLIIKADTFPVIQIV